jgi:hypothetical protein
MLIITQPLGRYNRLHQELKWIRGMCAYCNGTGKVDCGIESNVPVDASYVVANLDETERNGLSKDIQMQLNGETISRCGQ